MIVTSVLKELMKKGITGKVNRYFSYYFPIIYPLDFFIIIYSRRLYISKAPTNCNVIFVFVYAIDIHKKIYDAGQLKAISE